MNTENKTVEEKALSWWRKLSPAEKHNFDSIYFDKHQIWDDNNITMMYLSEHPSENEVTELQERLWDGLTGTPIEKEDEDAEIEKLEQQLWNEPTGAPPTKEQSKGVIEKGDEALQVLIKQLDKFGMRKYTCINACGYSLVEREIVSSLFTHFNDTHYTPLLELCGELLNVAIDLEERMTRARGILNRQDGNSNWGMLNTSMETPVIEKAKQLLNK